MKESSKPRPNMDMVKAACKWWGDVIMDARQDNGDSMQSGIKGYFSSLLPPVTEEIRDKFVTNLEKTIVDLWDTHYYAHHGGFSLTIDYGVGEVFQIAKKDLDIPDLKFPMKTDMIIGLNYVKVSYGYRSPWEVIAGVEEENK